MNKRRLSGHSFVILGVVIVCAVLFSGKYACADGKHFPEKAYKKSPAIPSQRAILVYKDGTEKLIIESALDGQGREFGWVIPLPSKPTEFEKTSAGLINTFSLTLQPEIIHDLARELYVPVYIAAFITFACLIIVFTKPPERVVLLVLYVILFVFIMMPPLSRVKMQAISSVDQPGIRIHDVRQVGSYELTVLEAENSHVLDTWLGDNGFAGLTEEDEKIVSDYIEESWCFVAAKLARDGDGFSRPHPLSMTFACDKPIYPMRLTATTGSDVYLELYVIADKQAICDALTLEVSDAYRFRKERKESFSGRIVPSDFAAETHSQDIGHSDAAKVMWDGCVLSKLCGTLKPEQMGEDIVLQLKTGEPYQKRYYSHRGATDTGLAMFLRMWCGLPILLAVLYHRRRKQPSGTSIFIKKALVPSVLLSVLVWALTYAVLPKIDVRTLGGGRVRFMLETHRRTAEIAMLADDHDDFTGMGKDEIAGLLGDYFTSKNATNRYSGEPLKHEDSPGDYTIIEDDRGVVWRTYSHGGHPDDHIVKPSHED